MTVNEKTRKLVRQITCNMSLRAQRSGAKQSLGSEIASLRYRFGQLFNRT